MTLASRIPPPSGYTPRTKRLGGSATVQPRLGDPLRTVTNSFQTSTASAPTDFWDQLVKSGLIEGQSGYYSSRQATPDEYVNAYQVALKNSDPTQRTTIIDQLAGLGAISGDPSYWYQDRGSENADLFDAINRYYTNGPRTGTSSTTAPSQADSWRPLPDGVKPGYTPEPNPDVAPSTVDNSLFWGNLVGQGLIEGDPNYYANLQGMPEEFSHAIRTALGSAGPAQRKMIVDYLFDAGVAQGDRNYWYQPRGAEDESLAMAAASLSPNSIGFDSPDPNQDASISPELDRLRNERLAAAIAAINSDFNMQEGTLEGQLRTLLSDFNTGMATSQREQALAQEAALANAEARGIFHSGITAKNLTRAAVPYQEQQAALIASLNPEQGAEGFKVRQIQSAIELLNQQREQAIAQARIEKEQEELDLEQLIALMEAGLTQG